MKNFIFSKIHFTGLFAPKEIKEILNDLISIQEKDGFIPSEKYSYFLEKIEERQEGKHTYFVGKLIKVNPRKEEPTINPLSKEKENAKVPNAFDEESFFVLHPKKFLIAFEKHKKLTENQFIKAFIALYRFNKMDYEPEFDFTFDKGKLFEKLKRFKTIDRASFKLKATNPSADPDFKPLDDSLQNSGAKYANLILEKAKDEDSSLNFSSGKSLLLQGLSMASQGFGTGSIYGLDIDGHHFTLKTEDQLESISVKKDASEEEIFEQIIFKFQKKESEK